MRDKKPYRTVDVQRICLTPEKWAVAVVVAKGTVNAVTGSQCALHTPFRWNHPAQSELVYQLYHYKKLAETAPQ